MDLLDDLRRQINSYMPYEAFVRIFTRLAELKLEEESKLKALGDLQQMYLSANSDSQKETVKQMVGKIRDLSKAHRQEMRSLNDEIQKQMPLALAQEFHTRLLEINSPQSHKEHGVKEGGE